MTPPNADTLTKARALIGERRFQQAETLLARHIKRSPTDADALDLMGVCFASQMYKDRALYYFQAALRARPRDVHLALHVAEALCLLNRESEAADTLLPLADASPGDAFLNARAAKMLTGSGRLTEARRVIDAAITLSPDDPGLLHAKARYCNRLGDSDQALRTLQHLQRIAPGESGLQFTLANVLNYNPGATPRDQYVAHAAAARAVEASVPEEPFTHAATDDPTRKIKVGILSPDFRTHSVAFFLEPLLDHLDRSRFSVHGYYTRTEADDTTLRLRGKCDTFLSAVRADHAQLARKINDDRIDILFDLGGLFAGHSLPTLYLKPAPVQVTYLGYPNTTGLRAIDYRIVDSLTDPVTAEPYTSETLVRLDPCFVCYGPDPAFGAVAPGAPRREGRFTFGCFNIATKLSDGLIKLWAQILNASPGADLFIKSSGMEEEPVRSGLRERMARAGMPLDRVRIVGRVPGALEHLALYGEVDLALDSFAYNGTTTTCEALFMGVPVLTLAGQTHASRVGASLLTNAGMHGLVCASPDEYVERATAFAADRERLLPFRTDLRARFLASPVCDGPAFGARMSQTLIRMWQARCQGERPAQ